MWSQCPAMRLIMSYGAGEGNDACRKQASSIFLAVPKILGSEGVIIPIVRMDRPVAGTDVCSVSRTYRSDGGDEVLGFTKTTARYTLVLLIR
jgi:hypothetical protein